MKKSTVFFIVLSLLGWVSAYRQRASARYWEGRANREIRRADMAKNRADTAETVATDRAEDLQWCNSELTRESTRLTHERGTVGWCFATLDRSNARFDACKSAVELYCPALRGLTVLF